MYAMIAVVVALVLGWYLRGKFDSVSALVDAARGLFMRDKP